MRPSREPVNANSVSRPTGRRACGDDEPSLVTVVAGYLQREGFEVHTVADGESALATARRTPPDVVCWI
jgi:CheY-like chemotaxis protein